MSAFVQVLPPLLIYLPANADPGNASGVWVPVTHVVSPDGVPASWLWPCPASTIVDMWELNQQMEDISVCLILGFKQTNKKDLKCEYSSMRILQKVCKKVAFKNVYLDAEIFEICS